MDIKKLTRAVSVSEQINHGDLARIAACGFKTVINNRPDKEARFQPRSQTLARYAAKANIDYIHLPVISGGLTNKDIEDFKAILQSAQGPILAFCRTGTRSALLWAGANPDRLSAAEVSAIGAKAGYAL